MKIKLSQLRRIIKEEVEKTLSQHKKDGWPDCNEPGCTGKMKPNPQSGNKTSLYCSKCGAEKKKTVKLESRDFSDYVRDVDRDMPTSWDSPEEAEKVMTTFECRICGEYGEGEASPEGPAKIGWSYLAGIDGPNSVCPKCAEEIRKDPSLLDSFRDDGYPNVRLKK